MNNIISFEWQGYPGTFTTLDINEVESVMLEQGPSATSMQVKFLAGVSGDRFTQDYIDGPTARKLVHWLSSHANSFTVSSEGGIAKFVRSSWSGVVRHSQIQFADVDLVPWRLDSTSLQWLAIKWIKGQDYSTVSYIPRPDVPQREHRIGAGTAKMIGAWIIETRAFEPVVKPESEGAGNGEWTAREKPAAYVTPLRPAPRGYLEADALACLEDVVSHASDIHEALAARRLKAHDQDREDGPIDAPVTSLVGDAESYWKKQQEVHTRMVEQAKRALELHKRVSA